MKLSEQQQHKEECHVRWMLITKPHAYCVDWLNRKPEADRERYRDLLNSQKKALKELSRSELDDIAKGQTTMKRILAMQKLAGDK